MSEGENSLFKKQQMVVVGGAMRSGTTVIHRALCTALNANPYISESWFLHDLMNLYSWNLTRYEVRHADQFGSAHNFRAVIRQAFETYIRTVSVKYNDPEILFFKHPELTRHFQDIGQMFPETKFILIVRDPRDVIVSMRAAASQHQEKRISSPISGFTTMDQWCGYYMSYYRPLTVNAPALAKRLMVVRYEDVMSDPRSVMEKIGKFTGATYNLDIVADFDAAAASSKNFDKKKRLEDDLSSAFWSDLYTKSLSTERIGRYADSLSPSEIEQIETRLAAFGKRFAYW